MADTKRKDPAKKPSVTSHKLFPAVTIVWFAALFGLASLAIRPAAIESLVVATGIDHVIAQAAPPLGNTMRILLSLLMTLLGAVIGLIVARRLAKPASAHAARRRRAEPADDDVPAVAAFGCKDPVAVEDDEDEAQPIARRRQQLALLDEDDGVDDQAPLPSNAHILDVAELPLKSFDEVDGIWLHESDRSKVHQEPETDHKRPNGFAHDISVDEPGEAEFPAPEANDAYGAEANGTSGKPSGRLFDSYVRRLNADAGLNDSNPAPGFLSLTSTEAAGELAAAPEADKSDESAFGEPAITAVAEATSTYGNGAERIAAAPLDELSHVELLERLAQTIARRRATRSAATEPASAPAVPAPEPEETPPEVSAKVTVLPRYEAPRPARVEDDVPAALRPHWADVQDDDDDDALPAYVPPRSFALPRLAPQQGPSAVPVSTLPVSAAPFRAVPISHPNDSEILDEGYSSLRGMTKSTLDLGAVADSEPRQAEAPSPPRFAFPTRPIEEAAPVAPLAGPRMFDAPQSAEPAPDQTEQALRAALATLRRMSGTA